MMREPTGGERPAAHEAVQARGRLPAMLKLLARPALLIGFLLGAVWLIRLLPGLEHMLTSRSLLRDGARGRLLFLGAGALICGFGLPRQAVSFAGGVAYGPVAGIALSTLANLAGCLADLLWARTAGGRWVRRRLSGPRRARAARLLTARPFAAILILRLSPVGSSLLVSVLAGVLGVRILPFLAATLLGSLPQTVVFVLIGSGARVGHGMQIGLGLALFLVSGAGGILLLRRARLAAEPIGDL